MGKNAPYYLLKRMKDRIRQIMESKKMTQQEFAQFIEVSAPSLSNIFTDRTRPTLNIVEAIKKKIPDINTNWLLFGSGQMYDTPSAGNIPALSTASDAQNEGAERQDPVLDFQFAPEPMAEIVSPQPSHVNSVKPTRQNVVREEVKNIDKPKRRVTEIRIFYDDQTWESFVPSTNR